MDSCPIIVLSKNILMPSASLACMGKGPSNTKPPSDTDTLSSSVAIAAAAADEDLQPTGK